MNVLALYGSPRKEGSTARIIARIIEGMNDNRKETVNHRSVYLNEVNIRGCQGCLACVKKGVCPIKDDMHSLYEELQKAEVIILGSPVYFNDVSAQTKLFIDRNKAFFELIKKDDPRYQGYPFLSRISPGKLGITAVTCALPKDTMLNIAVSTIEGYFRIMGIKNAGTISCCGLRSPEDLHGKSVLADAFEMGRKIGVQSGTATAVGNKN